MRPSRPGPPVDDRPSAGTNAQHSRARWRPPHGWVPRDAKSNVLMQGERQMRRTTTARAPECARAPMLTVDELEVFRSSWSKSLVWKMDESLPKNGSGSCLGEGVKDYQQIRLP